MAITQRERVTLALQLQQNPLQLLMYQWTEVTAYNAMHIVKLRGDCDPQRWRTLLIDVLSQCQSTLLNLFDPQTLLLDESHDGDLTTGITQQLNQRFADDDYPIRAFLLREGEVEYYFGLCYNHWIADSVAMRYLMQHALYRYADRGHQVSPWPAQPEGFVSQYQPVLQEFSPWRVGLEAFKHTRRYRGVYRTPMIAMTDYECGYDYQTLAPGLLQRLRASAQRYDCSINDIFIAALAHCLGEYWAEHRGYFSDGRLRLGRNRISIGTIADIRNPSVSQCFGQYLGSSTVVVADPEQLSTDILLQQVHRQAQRAKRQHSAITSHYQWQMASQWWRHDPRPEKQARLFIKSSPVMAGISNVNLDACSPTQAMQALCEPIQTLDYWRVSPTGPLLPLVFTLTTRQGELSLGVTYRKTAYSAGDVARLCAAFNTFLGTVSGLAPHEWDKEHALVA